MNFDSLSDEFNKKGYIYIENFFNDSLMDTCHKKILTHFASNPEYKHDKSFIERSDTDVIPWFPQLDGEEIFNTLENDINLKKLTENILGKDWKALYSMVMISSKSSNGQAWHQDCNSENKKFFNLNRLVYTMDINNSTGGEVVVIEGSHENGIIPSNASGKDIGHEIIISPKKGSLLLLHGHLWHKVLPINNHVRASTNYRCVPKDTPDDITDICVYRNMLYRFSDNKVLVNRN